MRPPMPLVVFSDLDGTLLDHDTYDWSPALPALNRLRDQSIPVVLASSKTAAEVIPLQSALGLTGVPAIVENGAGVIGIGPSRDEDTSDFIEVRDALERLPSDLRAQFRGFGDMSAQEVADATGLDLNAATRAKTRAFSEPGIWSGAPQAREDMLTALRAQGIVAREGGRFLTLSFGKTKQDRMSEVAAHFGARTTLALGDAPNDVEMLEHADYGFIIANPHRAPLPELAGEAQGRIVRTTKHGPIGWNAAIKGFLDRYDWTTERRQSG